MSDVTENVSASDSTKEKWRELGFYYDLDDRISVNQWRFFGSKTGLNRLLQLLDNYISDPRNAKQSEHEHYGPYMYLTIMTWNEPMITDNCIAGTLENLKDLRGLISNKLEESVPGQTFEISEDYGTANTVTARFFVMADDFDPVSIDELIVSGRQAVVNAKL